MEKERRYWDSNLFLCWLNKEQGHHDKCKGVLDLAEKGKIEIVTSALTIAEVIYLKGHPKITKEKSDNIINFFKQDYIILINVDRQIAELARELIWENSSLKPYDATHAASAIYAKVKRIDTFDDDLIKLDNKIGTPPIRIGQPDVPYNEILI